MRRGGGARWREWMLRVEAVIFASAEPVTRDTLARVVGKDCSIDLLIDDLQDELRDRPYELVSVAGGWQHRTRTRFADTIRASTAPTRSAAAALTVTFNGESVERRFPPSATVARVKRWAAEKKFGMSEDEAGEHVLQIASTHDRPAPGTHIGSLTESKICNLAFDLVPDERVNGAAEGFA